MRHLRADYNAIQPFPVKRPHIVKIDGETVDASELRYKGRHMEPLIPDDEPVLLLRGQDPAAAKAVRSYIRYAAEAGADPEFLAALDRWAEEMADHAERVQHGPPDVPAGMLRPAGDAL